MTNSTDAMKETINNMFAEPINEVEEAFVELLKHTTSFHGMSLLLVNKLSNKILNLKSMLPTVQG